MAAQAKKKVMPDIVFCLKCNKLFKSEDPKKFRLCWDCKRSIKKSICTWDTMDGRDGPYEGEP